MINIIFTEEREMTGNKNFEIRDVREGTGIYQPAFIDVLISNVLVKGIEV